MYNDYGFFRDLYLFRTGVKLTPAEVWDISYSVTALQQMAEMRNPEKTMIEYGHPEPIGLFFPEFMLSQRRDGLANLREVARPTGTDGSPIRLEAIAQIPVSTERPLRHIN